MASQSGKPEMPKFTIRPSSPEALRQEFLNDILRRIDWLAEGAGAWRVKEQMAAQAAINELSLLLKFWQGVVIEPQSEPRKRIRSRGLQVHKAPKPEESAK